MGVQWYIGTVVQWASGRLYSDTVVQWYSITVVQFEILPIIVGGYQKNKRAKKANEKQE